MEIAVDLDDLSALVDLAARAPKTPAETRFMTGLVRQINLKAKLAEVPPPKVPAADGAAAGGAAVG